MRHAFIPAHGVISGLHAAFSTLAIIRGMSTVIRVMPNGLSRPWRSLNPKNWAAILTKAQKEVAVARHEAGNDAAALAALKSVEQHLAAAAKHHQMLHEECCKDSVDGGICMRHCNQILLELDKAQAEQDALIRDLEIKAKPARGTPPTRAQQR